MDNTPLDTPDALKQGFGVFKAKNQGITEYFKHASSTLDTTIDEFVSLTELLIQDPSRVEKRLEHASLGLALLYIIVGGADYGFPTLYDRVYKWVDADGASLMNSNQQYAQKISHELQYLQMFKFKHYRASSMLFYPKNFHNIAKNLRFPPGAEAVYPREVQETNNLIDLFERKTTFKDIEERFTRLNREVCGLGSDTNKINALKNQASDFIDLINKWKNTFTPEEQQRAVKFIDITQKTFSI